MKKFIYKDPPQFEEWLSLYKEHYIVEEKSFNKIKPLPDWIDSDKLKSDIPEISIVDLKKKEYSEEDEYNSMTLIDIIKLCMWMRLNLIMNLLSHTAVTLSVGVC